ncbi:hypothetical protein H0H93_015266 [Arthromyces matolae]|nr:hypothetical protein H0H93_015266 [Arthromyces matolae]
MTSTLDACFQSAEQTAKKDLTERAEQLGEAESEFADQKARFQAEKAVEFYDELSEDNFAQTAPKIMQAFLAHGNESERIEAEALQLALHPPKLVSEGEDEDEDEDWDAPLRVYTKMLDTLESLHAEALNLETSITTLTSSLEPQLEINSSEDKSNAASNTAAEEVNKLEISDEKGQNDKSAQAQILGVFRACLPVLRARIANLAMAQELVDGARENMSISLRMESLGLLDE